MWDDRIAPLFLSSIGDRWPRQLSGERVRVPGFRAVAREDPVAAAILDAAPNFCVDSFNLLGRTWASPRDVETRTRRHLPVPRPPHPAPPRAAAELCVALPPAAAAFGKTPEPTDRACVCVCVPTVINTSVGAFWNRFVGRCNKFGTSSIDPPGTCRVAASAVTRSSFFFPRSGWTNVRFNYL